MLKVISLIQVLFSLSVKRLLARIAIFGTRVRFPREWTQLFWRVIKIIHDISDLVDDTLSWFLCKFKVCVYQLLYTKQPALQ